MKTVEYGREHPEVIVLLHGGGLCWWQYREAAEQLAARYHVVLPVLDGHAGSEHPFTTMADAAAHVIEMIDQRFGGHVKVLGGLSLGGQIALEALALRPEICRYALIESALAFPLRMTAALTGPAFSLCYPLIRQRWFARLQFRQLGIRPALFEEYFRDTAAITREDLIAFLRANAAFRLPSGLSLCSAKALVTAGSRERPVMKRSARAIAAAMPRAQVRLLPGYGHGDLSINHAEAFVQLLLALTEQPRPPA